MYRRNMSGKLKKVVLFLKISALLLLSRPYDNMFEYGDVIRAYSSRYTKEELINILQDDDETVNVINNIDDHLQNIAGRYGSIVGFHLKI